MKKIACVLVKDRAAAENENAVVFCECLLNGDTLQLSEVLLAVLEEDVRNLQPGDLLDIEVSVAKRRTEPAREQSANRALTCSGRTYEDYKRRHQSVHDQCVEVTAHVAAHFAE